MQLINPKRITGVLLTCILLATAAFAQNPNQGDRRCNLSTLRGSYGYVIQGGVFDSSDPTFNTHFPFAGIGRITFDGQGGATGTELVNFAGFFIDRVYTGTYTIQPDCTGIFRRVEVPASNSVVRFVVVDNAKQIYFMQIDNPDAAITGTATKQ